MQPDPGGELMRAVLDTNVLVSALLSGTGAPARLIVAWQQGSFELVLSPLLLDELERVLAYPKLRRLVFGDEAEQFIGWLTRSATMAPDPIEPPEARSPDPGDDYLVALAAAQHAALVTGDAHLHAMGGGLPIHTPAHFLQLFA